MTFQNLKSEVYKSLSTLYLRMLQRLGIRFRVTNQILEKAAEIRSHLLQKNPHDSEVLYHAARHCIAFGRNEEANSLLEAALKISGQTELFEVVVSEYHGSLLHGNSILIQYPRKDIGSFNLNERYWQNWSFNPDSQNKIFLRNIKGEDVDNISREYTNSFISQIVSYLDAAPTLLEVACGTGLQYEKFLKKGLKIKYTGIDITTEHIKAAQELFPEGDFRIDDAFNLSFSNESYDIVFARALFEHLPHYSIPIKEMWRVAKIGILIDFYLAPQADEKDWIYFQDKGDQGNRYHFNIYSKPKLLQFLKSLEGIKKVLEGTYLTTPETKFFHKSFIVLKYPYCESINIENTFLVK